MFYFCLSFLSLWRSKLGGRSSPSAAPQAVGGGGKRHAINGLRDVGKTKLADEYARRYADEYPSGVAVVTADDAATNGAPMEVDGVAPDGAAAAP